MTDQPKAIPTRKIALLFVEPAGFAALFTKGFKFRANTKVVEGIPADATVETIYADAMRGGIMILLRSEHFKPVMNGVMPPILPISISVGK